MVHENGELIILTLAIGFTDFACLHCMSDCLIIADKETHLCSQLSPTANLFFIIYFMRTNIISLIRDV